jgi:hypothetical protein
MSLDERLAALFAEICLELQSNPTFAARIERALSAPEPRPVPSPRPHRRKVGPIDPFSSIQRGEQALRDELEPLDIEQLKDIIAEHAMDRSKLAMKWKSKDRLIAHIIATVDSRFRKGDAFRENSRSKNTQGSLLRTESPLDPQEPATGAVPPAGDHKAKP